MSDSFLSNNPTEVESMKKVGFKIKDYNKKIYDYSINQKEVEKGKKDKTIYQKRVDSLKKYLE
jgi:GTP cyclohydrolase II